MQLYPSSPYPACAAPLRSSVAKRMTRLRGGMSDSYGSE